ncbi:MAG: baseplate J/gp47 family protein [Verrucomicrobiales bacterium]|nr:baseplate J/gp47 family protein [Verrucomicrobiales bacterium]MCP5527853.1 baseplate J/gp47 family protein [Verrucomicrobiales bacterium]
MIPTATQHPLPRDGTSQEGRVPPALDPARRLLDDRELEALLGQLTGCSRLLIYHDLGNRARGTWEPFFAPHFAVRLATLANTGPAEFRADVARLSPALTSGTATDRLNATRRLLLLCARTIGGLGREWESLQRTAFGPVFSRSLYGLLRPTLVRVLALAKVAPDDDDARWLEPWHGLLPAGLWQLEVDGVPPATDPPDAAQFQPALARALTQLAEQIAVLQERVAAEAAAMLSGAPLTDGSQPPHLGLFLAWLRLFRHGQAALNDLVRRHLEFYYRCVLRIAPRAAVPDRAFVVAELAKNAAEMRLPEGTLLHAGKDAAKAAIQFSTVRDVQLNRARVIEKRSTFLDRAAHGCVRAAMVADSADGLGEALPDDSPAWPAFGHPGLPAGRLGLALAAPVLRLTGGTKTVTLTLGLSNPARDTLRERCNAALPAGAPGPDATGEWPLDGLFTVSLTAPDGWWTPSPSTVQGRFAPDAEPPALRLAISGIPVEQTIAAHVAETHQRAYRTPWPVLELTRNPPTAAQPGSLLDGLQLVSASIECQVTGDTHLVVANDAGAVDAAKPFPAFGAGPSVNSSLYVGSPEIFAKQLTALRLKPEWKNLPTDLTGHFADYATHTKQAATFRLDVGYLEGGAWKPLAKTGQLALESPLWSLDPADLERFPAAPDLPEFTGLESGLSRGFVRLRLTSPAFAFGHAEYGNLVAYKVAEAIKNNALPTLPPPPLSPALLRLEAAYTAREGRDLSVAKRTADTLALFHVEPHGEWEVAASAPTVLPSPPADGTFHLGIENLAGGQEVALLFHLADGSGNPFVGYPAIVWEYLADDTWLEVPSNLRVSDSTHTLRRTGVAVFGIPAAATTDHTRMPSGRIWLRATATGAIDALNRAYAVTAQAVEAVFVPQPANDLSRLEDPLPAGSVARLAVAQPTIKKVLQPLPSTGGRTAEQGTAYYRRVSERLRHRRRAVASWDYERLLLEAFPALHKVKCIPHTSPDAPDSALAPGHVTVVLVPVLTADAFDRRRPAASQDLLAEVRKFLANLVSAHVRLHVVNAAYEEVKVEATLVLRAGRTDTGFYEMQAAAEVTGWLTPWVSGVQPAPSFDAGLYPSAILNFLEERDYVDYVAGFHVRHLRGSTLVALDPAKLEPTTERSLLTSAATHEFAVLPPAP